MTTLNVTVPTNEEIAAIKADNPGRNVSYGEPAEGYVKGTTIANVLNKMLEDAGFGDRAIKSQMVYNYITKGYIKTDMHPHVPVAEAEKFIRVQYGRRVELPEPELEENTEVQPEENTES